jgi:hypothetical protein
MNKKVVSPSLLVAMALLLVFAAAGAVQIMSLNSGLSLSSPINLEAPVAGSAVTELSLDDEAVASASRVDGKFANLVNEEAIASASRVDGKFTDLINRYNAPAEGGFADIRARNYGPEPALTVSEPVNDGGFAELRARNYAPEPIAAAVPQIRPAYHTGADLATDQRIIAKPELAMEIDQASAIELSEPLTNHAYGLLLDRGGEGDSFEAQNYGPKPAVPPLELGAEGDSFEARNYGAAVLGASTANDDLAEMRVRNLAAIVLKEALEDAKFAEMHISAEGELAEMRTRNYATIVLKETLEDAKFAIDKASATISSEPMTYHAYGLLHDPSADGGFADIRARNYGPEAAIVLKEAPADGGFAEIRARNYGPEPVLSASESVDSGFAAIRARNYGSEPALRVSETVDGGFAEIRSRHYGSAPALKVSESGTADPFAELREREDYVPGGPVGH